MFRIRRVNFIAILVAIHLTGLSISAQQNNDFLSRKITLVVKDLDEEAALRTLSSIAQVSIGFQKDLESKDPTLISMTIRKGTVRDALEAFIKANSHYKWETIGNVINIVPKNNPDSLLEVMVNNFRFDDTNLRDLGLAIGELPEIATRLREMRLTHPKMLLAFGSPPPAHQFSIDLPPSTLRDILNELLRRNYTRFWVVKRSGNNSEYVQFCLW